MNGFFKSYFNYFKYMVKMNTLLFILQLDCVEITTGMSTAQWCFDTEVNVHT